MKPALCAALLVLLSACGDRADEPGIAQRAAALAAGMNVDTLDVGGQPERITFREASGASFPLPFSARVPAPMAVTTERTAAGEIVRLEAAGQGAWTLTLLAAGTDEAEARSAADSVAAALGTVTADSSASALAAMRTAGAGRTGSVRLGQHAGRYFVVAEDAAEAARAAFEARVAYVLHYWTWTDDGTTLDA